MAKILFVNPLVREEDVPRHVPYGIALLAAIAMEKGHQVQVYDENAWRKGAQVLREVLEADAWDVVALGGITTAYASVKSIVRAARAFAPNALIVLGGGVLTSLPREMMTWLPEVDVGVIGEAFLTFPEVLERVDAGTRKFDDVAGTISRLADGRLHVAAQRELVHDLDTLPFPAWDLFPLEEVYFPNSQVLYSEAGMLASRRLDINASYGCSLICRYCYHLGIAGDMRYVEEEDGTTNVEFDRPGAYTRSIRYHSPEYVVRLAKHAHDKYGVNFITFLDENLMTMDQYSGRVWMKEICRLWKENGLQPDYLAEGRPLGETWKGVHWSGTSHATLCNPGILKEMRDAGCSHLVYGYESFAPHVMKTIGKGATPKTNIRSFFWTLEAGIRPIPNQIIGFPAEDFESIRLNMEAWKTLGIMVKPFFATPYPGSEWFTVNRASIEQQYGGDLEAFILDLGDATRISAVISVNFNAVELLGLREMMIQWDYRRIDEYEQIWRKNHAIPEGAPSTLFKPAKKDEEGASAPPKIRIKKPVVRRLPTVN
ncbi:MAG: cobalamin-dependent protein [Labilithrix sp.]|nr:cobalamin-dependent protein [Labilithrix sp.]MCW5814741.1 cobalamin-dependent protein [Labilithrix sp.]